MGDRRRKKANRTGRRAINGKNMAHWSLISGIRRSKKWIFESWLLKVGFQKCVSGSRGEHIFEKIWKRNASEQENYQKCILQITFLMQIRNKIWKNHKFGSVIVVVVLLIGLLKQKYTFFPAKIKILMGGWRRQKANRTGRRAINAKKMAHWSLISDDPRCKKWIFEGWLLRVGFQKCVSGLSGEHIFAKTWK